MNVGDKVPRALVIDMELACMNAFQQVFGTITWIIFCYFHWRKALRDQLQKKKVLSELFNSEPMQEVYKLITALPFVPTADVIKVFETVIDPLIEKYINEGAISEKGEEYFYYFESTYIGKVHRYFCKYI